METVHFLALSMCLLLSVTPALCNNVVETSVGKTIYVPCDSNGLSVRYGSWTWQPDLNDSGSLVHIANFSGQALVGPRLSEGLDMPWRARGVFSLRVERVSEERAGLYVCTLTRNGNRPINEVFDTEVIVHAAVPAMPRQCQRVLWLLPLGMGIGALVTAPLLSCLCDTLVTYNRRKRTLRKWYTFRLRTLMAARERSVIHGGGHVAEVLVIGNKEPVEDIPHCHETAGP